MRRLRVLVSAFALSPKRGSEAAVGWNICSRLGEYHDITVLYCAKDQDHCYQQELEAYLHLNGSVPGVTFRAIDAPPLKVVCEWVHDHGLWFAYYIGYAAWQRRAYEVASRLHQEAPFDVVHQLNMIGFREPGFLWRLGAPFVWGPVGGAVLMPFRFLPSLGLRGCLFHSVRNVTTFVQMRFSARVHRAAAAAQHIWAATQPDFDMCVRHFRRTPTPMLETGSTICPSPLCRAFDASRPLRLLWSGVHEARKALPLLLNALHDVARTADWTLTVLGSGPEQSRWIRHATRLGIQDRITWAGQVPHERALSYFGTADVFVLTSIQEGTPHVVLEALSAGVPVICHDTGGMGSAVTDECGCKIPLRSPDLSTRGFCEAILRFWQHPELIARLSRGALHRAASLTWAAKAQTIARRYQELAFD
jgi:glycosyltransferase involved in cell wall biosynthesis